MSDDFDKLVQYLQEKVLEEERKIYSERVIEEFMNPQNFGKIENPDSWSSVKGTCGDTVEIFLSVSKDNIKNITFLTDGCGATVACTSYLTRIVKGMTLKDAYGLEAKDIDEYFELPEENKHCADLAVFSLRTAIDKYYAKKEI
ncbi:MAG: iron-sulfur cluster assembly scaffold protein [Candidatus Jordarchaeum sp.]|uniref:iron-sulfur cluster assembly scaffold protein n=1 Tax=Candidatus Jordarchaeum sp. TaxID=2823881 RepID=UPI00404AED3A